MKDFLDEYFNDEYFWEDDFSKEDIEIDQAVYYPKYQTYLCLNCDRKFDEPFVEVTTKARLFGVDEMPNDERITFNLCPYCKSYEIVEMTEDL